MAASPLHAFIGLLGEVALKKVAMQHQVVSCPKCRQKNCIPAERNLCDASCGNCHSPLTKQSGHPLWFWILFCITIGPGLANGLWIYLIEPSSRWLMANSPPFLSSSAKVSAPTAPAIPAYWSRLDRLEPLLNDQSGGSFNEKDFLWFIYESANSSQWISYRRHEDRDRDRKVFREFLARRTEFSAFHELFEMEAKAAAVFAEIETEKRRLEIQLHAARNQEAFASGFESGVEGGQLGASAYSQGARGKEAVLTAAAYMALSAYVRFYQNEQELDALEREAYDQLAVRCRNRLDEISVKEQALRKRIQSGVTLEIVGGEVKGGVRRELDDILGNANQDEPNDPAEKHTNWAPRQIEIAEGLLRLRSRIPPDPIYDTWRAEASYWAAYFLEGIAWKESEEKPWGAIPSKAA